MAILFKLRDGEEWRTAMINLPVFPVRTPQAFNEQLLATRPDRTTGKPDPAKITALVARYPESAPAMQLIRSRPISSGFENSIFNSLNAFRFINAAGARLSVRWSMVPAQPFAPASTSDSGPAAKNYLFDALIAGIHRRPLEWRLVVTIAQPHDPTDDATIPGPAERAHVVVGTLTIDRVASTGTTADRSMILHP